MKKLLFGCTAAAVAMISTPAMAQYSPVANQVYGNPYANPRSAYPNDNMSMRIGQLQARLDAGVRAGSITRREARPIRRQIGEINYLAQQYSANGLTGQERAALQQRIRTVRQQLRQADDGAQGRYAQWDRDDGYAWSDQYSGQAWGNQNSQVDANRDGWDDRDYNRNGRWDDDVNYGYQQQGAYGQQGGYGQQVYPNPPQPVQSTGLAGLINSVLGGGAVQVGQRVPANLYGVPYQQQGQYRDGNGIYYRSDGRQIYQVDARSNTVIRIFPM